MTTENTTEIKVGNHPEDILSENLAQALAVSYLLGEQFDKPSSRFNDEILSDAVWTIHKRLTDAKAALDKLGENHG